ncbi:MAG: SCO1664 family protein [Candidatus Nanopelagicales bacterium]
MSSPHHVDPRTLSAALTTAPLEIIGQLSGASNATLLSRIDAAGIEIQCVYKPRRGERPLWDFPSGTLSHREVAAYELSRAVGWNLVPTTVWREEGPYGPGMCQEWVVDRSEQPACDVVSQGQAPEGWHVVLDAETYEGAPVSLVHEDSVELQRMALFDFVANNADRKGGHILRRKSGDLVGIDHGLTFHEDSKLRSVLWGWEGQVIPPNLLDDLRALQQMMAVGAPPSGDAFPNSVTNTLTNTLSEHLRLSEMTALTQRLGSVISSGVFPSPSDDYPALPWPPV